LKTPKNHGQTLFASSQNLGLVFESLNYQGNWWVGKSFGTEFSNLYVFPDGQLESVSTVRKTMEDALFEVHDVEGLRSHYAMTLREWMRRLDSKHDVALQYVTETTHRVWRLYMAGCAEQFEEGGIGIYQILASKRAPFVYPLPLTREDLYVNDL